MLIAALISSLDGVRDKISFRPNAICFEGSSPASLRILSASVLAESFMNFPLSILKSLSRNRSAESNRASRIGIRHIVVDEDWHLH